MLCLCQAQPINSLRRLCCATHCASMPRRSVQRHSSAKLFFAMPHQALAMRFTVLLRLCHAILRTSNLRLCYAWPRRSLPLLCISPPGSAMPLLCRAAPGLCSTTLRSDVRRPALPLPRTAPLCQAFASHCPALLYPCLANLRFAFAARGVS